MKLKDKPAHNIKIPIKIRHSNKISDGAKLLYGELLALSNHRQVVPSNKYLANLYNVSERTIKRRLKELKDNAFINKKGELWQ